jgi:uncharacterized membrane protein YbhN (UPF0104 family)
MRLHSPVSLINFASSTLAILLAVIAVLSVITIVAFIAWVSGYSQIRWEAIAMAWLSQGVSVLIVMAIDKAGRRSLRRSRRPSNFS